jgi:hypothetical protein
VEPRKEERRRRRRRLVLPFSFEVYIPDSERHQRIHSHGLFVTTINSLEPLLHLLHPVQSLSASPEPPSS